MKSIKFMTSLTISRFVDLPICQFVDLLMSRLANLSICQFVDLLIG